MKMERGLDNQETQVEDVMTERVSPTGCPRRNDKTLVCIVQRWSTRINKGDDL